MYLPIVIGVCMGTSKPDDVTFVIVASVHSQRYAVDGVVVVYLLNIAVPVLCCTFVSDCMSVVVEIVLAPNPA